MKSVSQWIRLAGPVALLVALSVLDQTATAQARSSRYAVINVGPADFDTANQLLSLYGVLVPFKAGPAASPPVSRIAPRPGPRTPPPRRAAEPARREARARPRGAGPAPAKALSAPIMGRALRRALAGLPHDEVLAMVTSALQNGKKLYATLHRKAAAEAFTSAISLLDRHVPWGDAKPLLIQGHTYLLLCHHAEGDKASAQPVAARLRELAQNKRPQGIPASVWSMYPLMPLPLDNRRQVTVKAPSGAQVYLDDQRVGPGPQVLAVGPGAHRVRVEAPGHRLFYTEVPAGTAKQTVIVSLVPLSTDAFADVRQQLAKLRSSADRWDKEGLKKLAKQLVIDHLLVCTLEGGALKARWFSRRLGKYAASEQSLPQPGAKGLPGLVLASFQKMKRAEDGRAKALAEANRAKGRKEAPAPKIWKKWYFWVAAAVVAGIVAAFAIKDQVKEDNVILRITRP